MPRRRRRRIVPRGRYGTEAELCDDFAAIARADGFVVHPETGGFDMLLVCPETGEQVGVEAKRAESVKVLAQALEPGPRSPGPEVHAVLVPFASAEFCGVAKALRLTVFEPHRLTPQTVLQRLVGRAPRWEHPRRLEVPLRPIAGPAGVPGPRKVTRWKLAAVELCLLARARGHVTRADLARLKLDARWWLDRRFGPVLLLGAGGRLTLNPEADARAPDRLYPEIAVALGN